MHRIAFKIFDRVQADFLVDFVLQAAPVELGNQYLVLERADPQRKHVVVQCNQLAGDFGDQVMALIKSVKRKKGKGEKGE